MERLPTRRIGRAPTRTRMMGIPVLTVMVGSMTALLPIIAALPILPPFGFMIIIAWRLLHRTLWPVWAAIPLGAFDDMLSGQPLGSAMILWTLAFFVLDLFDRRMMWRDSWQDWALAGLLIAALLVGELVIANFVGGNSSLGILWPQYILSLLLFPLVSRLCAGLDWIRQSS